jgi:hypothetical protein
MFMIHAEEMRQIADSFHKAREEQARKMLEAAESRETALKQVEVAMTTIREMANRGRYAFFCETTLNARAQVFLQEGGFGVKLTPSGHTKITW